MKESNFKKILLITDFDGTFYRGLCPFLFRGIANADLMIVLCLLNFFKPKRFFRLLFIMIRLWRLDRRLCMEYKSGQASLSEVDEQLIHFFAGNVLAYCGKDDIEMASRIISHLCYRDAWRVFGELKDKCEFRIVSKSFEFLLEKIHEKGVGQGLEIGYQGIKMDFERAVIFKDSVVRKEDKYSKVKELLANRGYEKAIVIGDTEDDIAMRDAAVELLGIPNVLFISLNAKDDKIAGAADRNFNSWKELDPFLENWS